MYYILYSLSQSRWIIVQETDHFSKELTVQCSQYQQISCICQSNEKSVRQAQLPLLWTVVRLTKTIPIGRPPTHYTENQRGQSLLAVHSSANVTNTRKLPRNDGKTPMPKLRFYADTHIKRHIN